MFWLRDGDINMILERMAITICNLYTQYKERSIPNDLPNDIHCTSTGGNSDMGVNNQATVANELRGLAKQINARIEELKQDGYKIVLTGEFNPYTGSKSISFIKEVGITKIITHKL